MFTTETSQMDTGTLNHSSVHPLIEYFGSGHSIRQTLGSWEGNPIPSLPELELIYPQTGFVIILADCDYFSLHFSPTPPDRWVSDFLSRSLNHSPHWTLYKTGSNCVTSKPLWALYTGTADLHLLARCLPSPATRLRCEIPFPASTYVFMLFLQLKYPFPRPLADKPLSLEGTANPISFTKIASSVSHHPWYKAPV